jgi:DUF1680 family protein
MNKIKQKPEYNDRLAVKDKLLTPQSGVSLNEGLFRDVFDNNREFLRTLDMGAMTYHFDIKTGTPTDAQPYRGHFEDNLKGSTLSMFLMGAANTLRWTEDDDLSRRAAILTGRLYSSAEEDGFIMPIDKRDFAVREYPHYVRIWLSYALGATGLAVDKRAYTVLRKWQDWFNNCIDLPIIKYLELAFQGVVASTYVYLTPVGKKEDIDTTIEYYEEGWRLAQFMRREKDAVHIRRQPGTEPHAHGSELEAFEGYLDLYRATGRNYYLKAVLGAWELYRADWQHAGGGIVMCEGMPQNYPGCGWIDRKNHYNELCCTSFWIYLNQRLHRLFPDKEEYTAEIEKSLFNVAIANQAGARGIRYFAYLEGQKQEPGSVHCCCGVGTRIYGSLPEFIYSIGKHTIAVNLYTPSVIKWGKLQLTSEADIPYSDCVRLTVNTPEPVKYTISLRIPRWNAADAIIKVNGKTVAAGRAGTYEHICRKWSDGDVIEFRLRQTFRITKYSGADEIEGKDRYGIEYGPILYAVTGEKPVEGVQWAADNYAVLLEKAPEPLCYTIKGHEGYRLVPYFALNDELFTCYPVMKPGGG